MFHMMRKYLAVAALCTTALVPVQALSQEAVFVISTNEVGVPNYNPITAVNTQLPAHYDDVFARALDKDPNKRFRTCGEFVDALRAAPGATPAPAPRSPRTAPCCCWSWCWWCPWA